MDEEDFYTKRGRADCHLKSSESNVDKRRHVDCAEIDQTLDTTNEALVWFYLTP